MSTAVAGAAIGDTDRFLREVDPALHRRWTDALPAATETVARRLIAAAVREGLGDLAATGDTIRLPGAGSVTATRHGFGRAEPDGPLPGPAAALLAALAATLGGDLPAELDSAVANLALGLARRPADDPFTAPAHGPDERAVAFERLATDGHNLHPCGRTRLGWTPADVLAHDLEATTTPLRFVGVRRAHLTGHDVGARLGRPGTASYAAQPVHPWQLRHLRAGRADLFRGGALADLDTAPLPAAPTAALRTLQVPGHGYLKVSLDIQVTSTRRTISTASTRNGPVLSRLLGDLLAGEPVLLLTEPAGGAAAGLGADRDLAAIHRTGLAGRLGPDEVAVPAAALTATLPSGRSVAATLLARTGWPPAAFVDAYARLLLPALLRLLTRHGIALEAHLQNCLPVFGTATGRPRRIVLRDLAGLRMHLPRLTARGHRVPLWPGSVVGTTDDDTLRAKLGYTALQAHLGELIRHLAGTAGLDEPAAWRIVRAVVDETYDGLRGEPGLAATAAADHAFWTAPTMPHKALVRMRLHAAGDVYVPVDNPLAT